MSIVVVAVAACLTVFVIVRPGKDGSSPDAPASRVARVYDPPATYKPTPADAGVYAKLKSQIASLELDGVELHKAIDKLHELSGVNIRVNWPALAKEGVKPEAAVNVHLKKVTLNKAIRTVLGDFSRISPDGATHSGLGSVVEDGGITISSRSELAGHTYAREYDISDLVDLLLEYVHKGSGAKTPEPESRPEESGDEENSGLFDYPDLQNRPETRKGAIERIIYIISDCIDSESWKRREGTTGEIRPDGGKLVVTQSNSNHQRISDLLEKLRAGLKDRTGGLGGERTAESVSRADKLLARKIPAREFRDSELRKVIQYVREESGANIHVRWRALGGDDLAPDTRVSIRLKDSTLGQALDAICRNLTGDLEPGVGPRGPDYTVGDNVITISLKVDLLHEMSVGVYDVSRIVWHVYKYDSPKQFRPEVMDETKTLISDNFSSACWCNLHRGVESVHAIGDLLVIVQADGHGESITRLLGQLDASFRGRGPKAHGAVRIVGGGHTPVPSALRVYNVRDLVARIPPEACETCPLHLHQDRSSGAVRRNAAALIGCVVSELVDRDSWLEAGGEDGRMSAIGGLLVVMQTVSNHNAIEELLGNLRRHFKTPNLDARSYVQTPADRTGDKRLDVKIPKLNLEEVELQKAVEALCALPGVDLSVDRASFAKYKDEVDEKVSVGLTDLTVKEALGCIFDSVRDIVDSDLGYLIRDGRIELIDSSDFPVSDRIYDLRGLIAQVQKRPGPSPCREESLGELSEIIRDAIDPHSWAYAEESGLLERFDGLCIVRQTTANHEAISELIEWLEKYFKADRMEPYLPLATKTERLIRRKLARKTAKLELDNVEFSKAIQTVLDAAGLARYIWSLPVETSLASRKVNLKLKNVTFRQALDAIFATAADEFGLGPEYVIRHGVMQMGDDPSRRSWPVVRIYDIRDIIARKTKSARLSPDDRGEDKATVETFKTIVNLVGKVPQFDREYLLHADIYMGMLIVNASERKHGVLAGVLRKMRAEE